MAPRRFTTQGLTEGAIQAALVAAFALATRYVPVLGFATAFLVPLPLALLVIRRGLGPAILAALVAGTIAAMLAGPWSGLAILVTFAPFGIAVGMGVRRGRSAAVIVGMAAVVAVLSLTVNLILTLAISGVNPYTIMIESMRQGQEASMAFYSRLGIDASRLQEGNRQMMQVLALMPKLIPVLLLLGGVAVAWINYEIWRLILRRLGHRLPALPPASAWRIPGYALWLLPLAIALLALGSERPVTTWSDHLRSLVKARGLGILATIGLNLWISGQFAFAFQGVLVAWVLLKRYVVIRALRIFVLVFILFNPVLPVLVMLVGVADSIFRLRERFTLRPLSAEADA